MMINRDNYEAFMLDYIEGTISNDDRQELLAFLDKHPELKSDLKLDININLSADNDVFELKDQLLKHDADEYDLPVKDFLLIKHCEEGLSANEKAELILIEPDEDKQLASIDRYNNTVLQPDRSVTFSKKSGLRRSRLIPYFKQSVLNRSVAAIAAMALFASIWLFTDQSALQNNNVADNNEQKTELSTPEVYTAESKILEKVLPGETQPSKDSLLELSNNPMGTKKQTPVRKEPNTNKAKTQFLASIEDINIDNNRPINAYEHGLNVMMPQYMNNNLLRQELASIYMQIEEEEKSPGLSLAIVEGGVKVMNFLSKESVKMEKYYNADGKVIGYQVKGDNLEVNKRVK